MQGFIYNGIHCSAFGCYYVPDSTDRWWSTPQFDVYEQNVGWHDGGYYYGNAVKPRQIVLKCYYEEVTRIMIEKLKIWLDRNKNGKLVLDERPYVYYNVRPTKIVNGNVYNDLESNGKVTYSGTIEITFTAYDPFGYIMDEYFNSTWVEMFGRKWQQVKLKSWGDQQDAQSNDMFEESGLLYKAEKPSYPTTASRSFSVYNAGTQSCGLNIKLKGSCSNPIRIRNKTNGTQCVIKSLPKNGIMRINSDLGTVTDPAGNMIYQHHDHGFVLLEPGLLTRHIKYSVVNKNGNDYLIQTDYDFLESKEWQNKIIRIGTKTFRVIAVYPQISRIIARCTSTISNTGEMIAYNLNDIVIEEEKEGSWITPYTLSLSQIDISCSPRVY